MEILAGNCLTPISCLVSIYELFEIFCINYEQKSEYARRQIDRPLRAYLEISHKYSVSPNFVNSTHLSLWGHKLGLKKGDF